MIDGKVKYRRPTSEELELLREPVLTRVSFSSKFGNRLSNVLFVVALITIAFFGVNLSTVGGIVVLVQ